MEELESKCKRLEEELAKKDARISELEALLAEYKTVAGKKKGLFNKGPKDKIRKQGAKNKKGAPYFAVHIHLYDSMQLTSFVSYLENIPYKFDLYLSCPEGVDGSKLKSELKIVKKLKLLIIRPLPERGRDFGPLFVKFKADIEKYDYIFHLALDSKEPAASMSGNYSLEVLLGSRERIEYIFDLLQNDRAGLLFSDIKEERLCLKYSWLTCRERGESLLKEFGIFDMPEIFNYPEDGCFVANVKAIKPLLNKNFSYDDFERESGQSEGSFYHVLKRILPFISRREGFDNYILYLNEIDTRKNLSVRPFLSQIKIDKELLEMKLGGYDIVSFDIFDTLLTLNLDQPEDLFKVMAADIKEKYKIDGDFAAVRRDAERRALLKHGTVTNIDKIYFELADDKEYGDLAPQLKQLEIDTMYKLCVPRNDMVAAYNKVRSMGKNIILVSDMYLTKAHLVAMLRKCGIGNYDELFISWEIGARKSDGSLYEAILSGIDKTRYIHVGDDFYEDMYVLNEMGVSSHVVFNANTMLELSEFKEVRALARESVEDSMLVGEAVHGNIFNSPFVFDENGRLKLECNSLVGKFDEELRNNLRDFVITEGK